MSTYSDSLRIELITTGTQAGTWGTTTNTNLGTIIEDSIAGYTQVTVMGANVVLSVVDGAADEARSAILEFVDGGGGGNFSVFAPPVSKQYIVWNNTPHVATFYNSTVAGNTTPAGVGLPLASGAQLVIFSDGSHFIQAGADGTVTQVNVSGGTTGLTATGGPITTSGVITLGGTLAVANGGTGAATASGARTSLGATTVGSNMFTLTNPSAVTFLQVNADNTVSALDAASFRTAIGAGSGGGSVTSVALSGGTTGLTVSGSPITTSGTMTLGGTLAIANGGTGATSASAARTALDVPSTSGSGASGTWNININGSATSLSGSYVSSVDGSTGAVTLSSLSAFNRSLSSSGYQKLPGGLIIQWGSYSTSTGDDTITWPTTFPSACRAATASISFIGASYAVTSNSLSTSSGRFYVSTTGGTYTIYWMAIGY